MFQKGTHKKAIVLWLLFLFLSASHGMIEHPSNRFHRDVFFPLVENIIDTFPKFSLVKSINQFHFTDKNEEKKAKILDLLRTLSLVSRNFLQLTNQYIQHQNGLKKHLTPEDLFHYEINTNKTFCTNKRFLLPDHSFETQRILFRRIQWSIFFKDLREFLKNAEQQQLIKNKESKNSYLIKASKNTLKCALEIMYHHTINQLHNNKNTKPIDNNIFEIYKSFKNNNEFDTNFQKNRKIGWLDRYIQSNGEKIPNLSTADRSLFINYTKSDRENLRTFLYLHTDFCFRNETKIFDLLNHPRDLRNCFQRCKKKYRKPFLIMRFLMVFNAIEKQSVRDEIIYSFLTKLSNAYWFNNFNFF